jgi:hypothetical protein
MLRRSDQSVLCHCDRRGCNGKPLIGFSVSPEDGEAVLFGKAVNELQSDVVVSDDEVTGTLKYVDGYVDFSSNVSEQSGNYLALKIEAEPAEAETVVELVGGTKGPVTLDDDMNIVLLIKNKDTQSIKVTVNDGEDSAIKTYGLTGLTLETE